MKSIELFAGAGGLGIGTGKAGFRPVKVVEWDDHCVSTVAQGRSGLGLGAQRMAIKELCKAQGLEIIAEFTEVESGKRAAPSSPRPYVVPSSPVPKAYGRLPTP